VSGRMWSDLTVTDIFCGAGGNTIGAKRAGLRVRVGLNHWDRAIDTYGRNNPDVDVIERVDVSLCDPRRYPSTDIGIFSPECTTHSPAGGGASVSKSNECGPRRSSRRSIRDVSAGENAGSSSIRAKTSRKSWIVTSPHPVTITRRRTASMRCDIGMPVKPSERRKSEDVHPSLVRVA
jgi:hypothetical protein